jgi:hypothetical protein
MIRSSLVLLASVAVTFAARAAFPEFDTNWVMLQTGTSQTVGVRALETVVYIPWYPYYTHPDWEFSSDDESVAIVTGGVERNRTSGEVRITAVGPGVAHVNFIVNSPPRLVPLVEIVVVAADVEPAKITVWPPITAPGHPVTLTAQLTMPAVMIWYEGRIGDLSRPLHGSTQRQITYTPRETGAHYVWVIVYTEYTKSVAEARIDVEYPRRRSASH